MALIILSNEFRNYVTETDISGLRKNTIQFI